MRKTVWFLLLFLFFAWHASAQRNQFKLLGYGLNQTFNAGLYSADPTSNSFVVHNHSAIIGYERTLGNRLSVGLNYHLLFNFSLPDNMIYSNTNGDYVYDVALKQSGLTYESRYYFDDFDKGAPDASYISFSVGQFKYIANLKIRDAYNSTINPDYLGSLVHTVAVNKVSVRLGKETVRNHFLFDYYLGIDFNSWSDTYDKAKHLDEFNSTPVRSSVNFNFGMSIGFGI